MQVLCLRWRTVLGPTGALTVKVLAQGSRCCNFHESVCTQIDSNYKISGITKRIETKTALLLCCHTCMCRQLWKCSGCDRYKCKKEIILIKSGSLFQPADVSRQSKGRCDTETRLTHEALALWLIFNLDENIVNQNGLVEKNISYNLLALLKFIRVPQHGYFCAKKCIFVCMPVCACTCELKPLHRGSQWSWWEQSSWSEPLMSADAGTQDWSL